MKSSELQQLVLSGKIVCVGTYLSGKCDEISLRDKQSGNRRAAAVSREVVITETEPLTVSSWLPDGAKAADWKTVHKKGDKVVIIITGMEVTNGLTQLRGTIEPLA